MLESAGFVLLNIAVLNGSVGTDIVLDLSTIDGSALGENHYECMYVCMYVCHLGMLYIASQILRIMEQSQPKL